LAADAVTPSALNIIPGHEQLEVHAPYTDDEPDEWELDNLHLDINLEPTPKGDSRTFYS